MILKHILWLIYCNAVFIYSKNFEIARMKISASILIAFPLFILTMESSLNTILTNSTSSLNFCIFISTFKFLSL